MLKKTITFDDFNGEERTKDYYFNLTEAELAELQLSTDGGLDTYLKGIIESHDVPTLTQFFKKIILMSYGEKSADGLMFKKSPEAADDFSHTEAYSVLFMELATDSDKAADFINGIIPKKLRGKAAQIETSSIKAIN